MSRFPSPMFTEYRRKSTRREPQPLRTNMKSGTALEYSILCRNLISSISDWGANGHTASLFPRSPALQETSRLVVADFVAELNTWRITMTTSLLNRGREVAFLIAGQEKANVLREVLLGPRDPARLPAQLIAPEGALLWMVDEAAAAMLSRSEEGGAHRGRRKP